MIQFFLKLKHWQLFLSLGMLPILMQVFQVRQTNQMLAQSQQGAMVDPLEIMEPMFSLFSVIIAVSFITAFVLLMWLYSIVVGLRNLVPEDFRVNLTKFKFFFFAPIVYFVILIIGFGVLIYKMEYLGFTPDKEILFWIIPMIPLHLFSLFCMLYVLYTAAKTIKIAEVKEQLRFSQFAGEFFLLWLNFIGVWILQPRINKLYAGEIESDRIEL